MNSHWDLLVCQYIFYWIIMLQNIFLLTNYIIIFYSCVLLLVIGVHTYNIYLQLLLFNRTIYISNCLKKYVLNEPSINNWHIKKINDLKMNKIELNY